LRGRVLWRPWLEVGGGGGLLFLLFLWDLSLDVEVVEYTR
jgi:hypothetical protein